MPTLLAAITAIAWQRLQQTANGPAAPGAAAPALALPFLVAAALCAMRTTRVWPLFALQRPGADFVQRLQTGPLRGRGSAVAAALLAQLLLTLPLALLLPTWLGAPTMAHATVALLARGPSRLDPTHPTVSFSAPANIEWQRLALRAIVMVPEGPLQPTRLSLQANGQELTNSLPAFTDTGQRAVATFAPRAFTRVDAVWIDGTLPLYFPPGSVEATAAHGRRTVGNAAIAAGLALVPTFVALAAACLVGLVATLPTVTMVAASLLFVMTVGDVGPFGAAMRAVMRGEWLLSAPVFAAALPLLALGSLAMALAMFARPRLRA